MRERGTNTVLTLTGGPSGLGEGNRGSAAKYPLGSSFGSHGKADLEAGKAEAAQFHSSFLHLLASDSYPAGFSHSPQSYRQAESTD